MQDLHLPPAPLKLTRSQDQIYVSCFIRKKKLVLTPEEWVRQHILHFLMDHLEISPGRIVSEMGLKYNDMNRRADVVVMNEEGKPIMLVECKAPEIPITKKTLTQIAAYNRVYQVPFLFMSNGIQHYVMNMQEQPIQVKKGLEELQDMWISHHQKK